MAKKNVISEYLLRLVWSSGQSMQFSVTIHPSGLYEKKDGQKRLTHRVTERFINQMIANMEIEEERVVTATLQFSMTEFMSAELTPSTWKITLQKIDFNGNLHSSVVSPKDALSAGVSCEDVPLTACLRMFQNA